MNDNDNDDEPSWRSELELERIVQAALIHAEHCDIVLPQTPFKPWPVTHLHSFKNLVSRCLRFGLTNIVPLWHMGGIVQTKGERDSVSGLCWSRGRARRSSTLPHSPAVIQPFFCPQLHSCVTESKWSPAGDMCCSKYFRLLLHNHISDIGACARHGKLCYILWSWNAYVKWILLPLWIKTTDDKGLAVSEMLKSQCYDICVKLSVERQHMIK